jgi:curli biogenesis system outer membrane secretion channel CsgG
MLFTAPQSLDKSQSAVKMFLQILYKKLWLGLIALATGVSLAGCSQGPIPLDRHTAERGARASELAASDPVSVAANSFFSNGRGRRVAVAQFDDLTGARIEGGTSTAVAASGRILTEYILMGANVKGAYRVLDRAGLANLLNERRLADQINASNEADVISASPAAVRDQLPGRIPPLVDIDPLGVSDYLIYGAVVGYDRRLIDNGGGFGIAGVRMRNRTSRDQVSVIVQLVDVRTGEIIATGFDAQFIDSSSVAGDIFALLRTDRLLEFEQANLVNDPATLALFLAIDAALTEMFEDV